MNANDLRIGDRVRLGAQDPVRTVIKVRVLRGRVNLVFSDGSVSTPYVGTPVHDLLDRVDR
jgi:hypothetical protein